MGIRSCVYAAYFAFTALLFLLVTGFQWGGVLPSLPDCKLSCGVAVIQPLLLIGTPNTPCDTTDQNQQYYNNCFLCGTAGVEWPCPPISGAPGCMAGSTRIAETCVGQPGAVTVAGQPIVSDKSPDLAQCAAKLGTSATPDVCDKCIAAGQCVSGTKFEGAGSYTDAGVKYLCFTTPPRISLRPAMGAVVMAFLICYMLMSSLMVIEAFLLWCCFRKARGSAWYATQNSRIWKHVAGLVRYVPILIWGINVILMLLLVVAGFLFWGVGVCTDAPDIKGRLLIKGALQSSLMLGMLVWFLVCLLGGAMRIFVSPDGAFANRPVLSASALTDESAGKAPGCGARIAGCWSTLLKFGP